MRFISVFAAVAAASVCSFTSTASAWSSKEHIQITRLAVMRIENDPGAPAELKAWLKEQTPLLPSMDAEREWFLHESVGISPDPAKLRGLTWWVCVPDLEALEKGTKPTEPAGQHERFNHYIDLEFLNPEGPKRQYADDLSSLPKVSDFPRDVKDPHYLKAGYLPLARQNAYDKLVAALKAGKLAADPAHEEDQDHAVRWAAYLAHYTEDNTQPHHSTMDFKSASYFKGMRNSPNVHAEMEYRMADDPTQPLPELREEFWKAFEKELGTTKDDIGEDDVFSCTIEVAMDSYRNLPLIGAAAVSALDQTDAKKPAVDTTKFFHYRGVVDGRDESVLEMKAHQLAWAVVRTENVLLKAWNEAHAGK